MKFLMSLVSPIFLGTILNTQIMKGTNLYLSDSYMCWLYKSFNYEIGKFY